MAAGPTCELLCKRSETSPHGRPWKSPPRPRPPTPALHLFGPQRHARLGETPSVWSPDERERLAGEAVGPPAKEIWISAEVVHWSVADTAPAASASLGAAHSPWPSPRARRRLAGANAIPTCEGRNGNRRMEILKHDVVWADMDTTQNLHGAEAICFRGSCVAASRKCQMAHHMCFATHLFWFFF